MNILIAPDKFKGSLTAQQVCDAIKSGLQMSDKNLIINTVPLADGGEGSCEILTTLSNGSFVEAATFDPLMRPIKAKYGISEDGKTAFVEMASASGLQWLKPEEQNCMHTSTFGTGLLIRHAIRTGVDRIVLGLGGSATNDAGTGMAIAQGYTFLSGEGNELAGTGRHLAEIHFIDDEGVDQRIAEIAFIALTDVNNPLYGPDGAAYVFAHQKGASPGEVEMLDKGLQHFATIASRKSIDLNFPGAGAAGGLGAGARYFLDATVLRGTNFIFEFAGLEEKIKQADLVITGEGKLDNQTLSGKVVHGVAELARKHRKKVVAIVGRNELDHEQLQILGIEKVMTLADNAASQKIAMGNAFQMLKEKAPELLLIPGP